MTTDKLYDLPFFADKIKKIAGRIEDPVIQTELLFVSESLLEFEKSALNSDRYREELQRLLGGESPDWWDPNTQDFKT